MLSALARWASPASTSAARTIVHPDGCRDLIRRTRAGAPPLWFVSALDDHARVVEVQAGDAFTGWRMTACTVFDEARVAALCEDGAERDERTMLGDFGGLLAQPAALAEILAACAEARGGVADLAVALGVSERTLHRRLRDFTGRPPSWWLALARARRAATMLAEAGPGECIAGIASDSGHADQSHLTRECRRWFGTTPTRLRGAPGFESPAWP